MMTLLLTILIFALSILGLAIGYLIKHKTLKGSCGGLASMGIDRACDCKKPCGDCDEPVTQTTGATNTVKYYHPQNQDKV